MNRYASLRSHWHGGSTSAGQGAVAPGPRGWTLHPGKWAGLVLVAGLMACSGSSDGLVSGAAVRVVGGIGETLGRFRRPRAIAVDRTTGRFYVIDRTGRIQIFEAGGQPLHEWTLPDYALGQPVGVAIDSDGTVLVNDSHYSRILRFSADGATILARWGSAGVGPGQFTFGRDVAVDSTGNVYAGDYGGGNDRIQKFTRDGKFLLEWGGQGDRPGEFQRPQGMAIELFDGLEYLLVADCANHRVQRFSLDGRLEAVIGKVGRGPGEMRYPSSVVVGEDGTLYVSEWGNNRVQRFDHAGNSLGFWGQGGRAPGELGTPWDIDRGPDGKLFVVDYENHRVQIFSWPLAVSGGPRAVSSDAAQLAQAKRTRGEDT